LALPERRRLGSPDAVSIVAAVVSLLVACVSISAKKYSWSDEEFTRLVVAVPSTANLMRVLYHGLDSAPPLYHILAHFWVKLGGGSETGLRAFTSLSFGGALAVLWVTLRRVYSFRATAIGVLTTFCTSTLVLYQNAELRFYGLVTLLVAASFWAYMRAGRAKPTIGLLFAIFAINAALVMTHFFGALFSGAIFAAAVLREVIRRRWWWQTPAAMAASWLVFLSWLQPLKFQMDVGKPRHWTPMPQIPNLIGSYQFGLELLPFVLFAIVALVALGRAIDGEPARASATGDSLIQTGREDALLVAFALLAVPFATFLVSRLGTSVFVDRYLLPSIIAWTIILAHVTELITGDTVPRGGVLRLAWGALIAVLIVYPQFKAKQFIPQVRPGEGLERVAASGTPVVVEQARDLLPLLRYSKLPDEAFLYPLDWDLALDPTAPAAGVPNFKVFRDLRDTGFLPRNVLDGRQILCKQSRFYVVHDLESAWLSHRIATDSAYVMREVGRDGDRPIILVERRPEVAPPPCPASPA
jgi:hypothetical protein